VVRHVLVDSAFRRERDAPHDYRVHFNTLDDATAERLKDVVNIDIVSAHVPKMQQNVLRSLNAFDVHVVGSSVAATIGSVEELRTYLAGFQCTCTTRLEERRFMSNDGNTDLHPPLHYAIVTLSSNTRRLLCQDQPIPNFAHEVHRNADSTRYSMMSDATSGRIALSGASLDAAFTMPFALSLRTAESHPVVLEPGYYPSDHMMINEIFQALSVLSSTAEPSLSAYGDWATADEPGWSVRRDPKAHWTLYFRTRRSAWRTSTTGGQRGGRSAASRTGCGGTRTVRGRRIWWRRTRMPRRQKCSACSRFSSTRST
jgi:hypothetical protein